MHACLSGAHGLGEGCGAGGAFTLCTESWLALLVCVCFVQVCSYIIRDLYLQCARMDVTSACTMEHTRMGPGSLPRKPFHTVCNLQI